MSLFDGLLKRYSKPRKPSAPPPQDEPAAYEPPVAPPPAAAPLAEIELHAPSEPELHVPSEPELHVPSEPGLHATSEPELHAAPSEPEPHAPSEAELQAQAEAHALAEARKVVAEALKAAQDARSRGDIDDALEICAEMRSKVPGEVAPVRMAASMLIQVGRLDEAEALLESHSEMLTTDSGMAIDYAWIPHRRRDYAEAVRRWELVRQRFPDHPTGWSGATSSLREAGDLDAAEAISHAGVDKFPNDAAVLIEHASLTMRRRDFGQAAQRWEVIRERFPNVRAAYAAGARALGELGRNDEAEQLLQTALERFPDEPGFAIERARIAMMRRDWPEALSRWQEASARAPGQVAVISGQAVALRELQRYDEAEALLAEAYERLPGEQSINVDRAWIAQRRGDLAEALRRWEQVREKFPGVMAGYTGAAAALRDLHRFDEAEALLQTAIERFPADASPSIDFAWMANRRGDWPEAVRRWDAVRERFPNAAGAALSGGTAALRELRRFDEAEARLAEGMTRFPGHGEFALQHAQMALRHDKSEEAAQRFADVRARFPGMVGGWTGGALALRRQLKLAETDALLEEAAQRFPNDPAILLEYAQVPTTRTATLERDQPEAVRRHSMLCERFPTFVPGRVAAIRCFCDGGDYDAAEAAAADAMHVLPDSSEIALVHAEVASERADWPEAVSRYRALVSRFPGNPLAYAGLGKSLMGAQSTEEADTVLRDAMQRFPAHEGLFVNYAESAVQRQDWPEALTRWKEAQRRFPDDKRFAQRIFEAELRLTEVTGSLPADAPGPEASSSVLSDLDLVKQFESLGGCGHGCEFGIVQRECGAEPLGLLRWADLDHNFLIAALDTRFDGVGLPENTDIFVPTTDPDWWTRDKRYWMAMRTFIRSDSETYDRMVVLACRRLQFLRDKLVEDLAEGGKIFVFKNLRRNLSESELARLHASVRSYGNSTLLYVGYEDEAHPNGTVEMVAPGLMVGYIDHFAFSPDDKPLGSAKESWLAICRAAYPLWQKSRQEQGHSEVHEPALELASAEAGVPIAS